jgi:peptidoglycan-N-acetylglucosamine deacetylase
MEERGWFRRPMRPWSTFQGMRSCGATVASANNEPMLACPRQVSRIDMWNPVRHTRLYARIKARVLGSITHVRTNTNMVALTFDDGPDPVFTPRLLSLLGEHNVRATFFVLGSRVEQQPELVHRMVQEGHLLGNHTWSHQALPLLSRPERLREIRRCHKALPPQARRLLRPPYGYQDLQSRLDALRLGYEVVTWNAAADDCGDADHHAIADRIVHEVKPGAIVLLHDSLYLSTDHQYKNREAMLEALAQVLPDLCKSYRFVTVEELLRHGKPHREMWWRRPDTRLLDRLV